MFLQCSSCTASAVVLIRASKASVKACSFSLLRVFISAATAARSSSVVAKRLRLARDFIFAFNSFISNLLIIRMLFI